MALSLSVVLMAAVLGCAVFAVVGVAAVWALTHDKPLRQDE